MSDDSLDPIGQAAEMAPLPPTSTPSMSEQIDALEVEIEALASQVPALQRELMEVAENRRQLKKVAKMLERVNTLAPGQADSSAAENTAQLVAAAGRVAELQNEIASVWERRRGLIKKRNMLSAMAYRAELSAAAHAERARNAEARVHARAEEHFAMQQAKAKLKAEATELARVERRRARAVQEAEKHRAFREAAKARDEANGHIWERIVLTKAELAYALSDVPIEQVCEDLILSAPQVKNEREFAARQAQRAIERERQIAQNRGYH